MKTLLLLLLVALAGLLQAEHPSCYINLITIEGTVANQIRVQVKDQDAGTFTYTVHLYADDATKTSVTDVVNLSVAANSNTTYAITSATFGTGTKNLQDGQQHTIYFSCDTQTLGTIAPAGGDAWLYKWNVAGGVADYSYPLYTNSGRGATVFNSALVFNPNDPYSVGVSGSTVCTVGGTAVKSDGVVGSYVSTWGVPCANVHKFATAWSSTTTDITATQFGTDYAAITPAFSASEQYIALGFMLPVRVTGITATGNAGTLTNEMMSITGAFATGGTLIAPATLTSGGTLTGGEHLQGNPMFRTSSLTPFTTYGKRPAAMLAWAKCDGGGTGENCSTLGSTGVAGNWTANIALAQSSIATAKAAVDTNPTGGQIYVQSNSADFTRSVGFGLASPLAFGNKTAVAPASLNVTTTALISTGTQITQTNLLGYELAAAGPFTAAASTPTMVAAGTAYFLARTSSAGMLAGGYETPATWYLLKGAVFSAGSINEPYGLASIRYPEMMLFQSRYTRGATAIEAAWASTRDPWETVFVGDPLASPFSLSAQAPVPTRQVVFMRRAAPTTVLSGIAIPSAGTDYTKFNSQNVFSLTDAGPTDWKKWVATANDPTRAGNGVLYNAADLTLRKTAAPQKISDMNFTGVIGFNYSRFASNAYFDFSSADNDLSTVDYSASYYYFLGNGSPFVRPPGSSFAVSDCAPAGTLISGCSQFFTVAPGSITPQNLMVWTHSDSLNVSASITDGTTTQSYTVPTSVSSVVDERVITIPLTPATENIIYTVKLSAISTQPGATKGEMSIMAAALGGVTAGNVADAVLATTGYIGTPSKTYGTRVFQANPAVRIPAATTSKTLALGDDLQTAINFATCGTDIHLPLGYISQRTSTIILPNNGCTDSAWIRIIADGARNTFGQRAQPKDYPGGPASPAILAISNELPVVTNDINNGNPALRSAHHYAFVGVEITTAGETGTVNYALMRFSGAGYTGSNPTVASISHDIILQGVYVHRHSTFENSLNGIEFNVDKGAIYDSYIAGFQGNTNSFANENHAFYWDSANGPMTFKNNYLSAVTECVITGGVVAVPFVVTKDIEFDSNFFDKPASYNTQPYPPYDVKNSLEFKQGQFVSVTNNVFEHGYAGFGQIGQAVFLRSYAFGNAQRRTTSNYLVTNNIIRHHNLGFQVEAFDFYGLGGWNSGIFYPAKVPLHYIPRQYDIKIANNSVEDLSALKYGAIGRNQGPTGANVLYISTLPTNFVFDHNTGLFDTAGDNPTYQDNDHSILLSQLSGLAKSDTDLIFGAGHTTSATAPDDAASSFVFTNNSLSGGIHGDSHYGTYLLTTMGTYANNSFFNVPGYINNTFTSRPLPGTTSTLSTTQPIVANQGVNPATLPNDCTVMTGNRSDVPCTPGQ